MGSVQFVPNPSATFIPPNALNLRSFRKVVKKLEDLYPELHRQVYFLMVGFRRIFLLKVSGGSHLLFSFSFRDKILDALVEIKENKGLLSGLSLSSIVQMTSSLLEKRFGCKSDGKQKK